MDFQAWFRKVLWIIQAKFCCTRIEGPEDVEQPNPNEPCRCKIEWDDNNKRLPAGNRELYAGQGVPLYKAALNGDLKKMKRILGGDDRTILSSSLTEARETALHVAVGARQTAIVTKLVEKMKMEPETLNLQDIIGNTAFCVAAGMGSVKIAKILKEKHREVVLIRGANNKTPLYIAVASGNRDMIQFVYKNFREHINHLDKDELAHIFLSCIDANLFDLAIEMLSGAEDLAWARNLRGETALGILARKPSAFAGKSSTWPTRLLGHLGCGFNTSSMEKEARKLTELLCKKMSSDEQNSLVDYVSSDEILFEAAKSGNHKFLAELIGNYPDLVSRLVSRRDEHNRSIFHIAVLHRHAGVFNLIHKLGLQRDILVRYKVSYPDGANKPIYYNMLHLAAKLPSSEQLSTESGAALQMRRELLWFKEVEKLTPSSQRAMKDSKDKLIPRELFTKEHEELRKAGEKWMKHTAESCMIVATLVTAVVFTVTSSLPGSNDPNNGIPLNINKAMFHVFAVADAVALYSSITSTLLFLSIFTSRYTEDHFLRSLPMRLGFGITALLIASFAMMVEFAAVLILAYGKQGRVRWVLVALATSILPAYIIFWFQSKFIGDWWCRHRNLFRTS